MGYIAPFALRTPLFRPHLLSPQLVLGRRMSVQYIIVSKISNLGYVMLNS